MHNLATTHYGEIKNFSKEHPDFENAAMEFERYIRAYISLALVNVEIVMLYIFQRKWVYQML